MDPVSILGAAAAASQFLVEGAKVVQYCYGYVQKYKQANSKVVEFSQQLRALIHILTEVHDILTNRQNDVRSLECLSPLIDDANVELLQVQAELPKGKLGRLQRMKWPFTVEKTSALIKSLSEKVAMVHLSIGVEDIKISQETLAYVKRPANEYHSFVSQV